MEVVKLAFKELGWGYKILWDKEFEARIPTTNWSWHHEFKVTFQPFDWRLNDLTGGRPQ